VAQLVAYGHLEQPTATRLLDEVLATIPHA